MRSISVFEIIKLGIGPSSSHTMGPWKAAQLFLEKVSQTYDLNEVKKVKIELYGSLAKTGHGHGTDVAILLGLSGYDYSTFDTDLVTEKYMTIRDEGFIAMAGECRIAFDYERDLLFHMDRTLDFHPNGLIFTLFTTDGQSFSQDYYSIGGGFVVTKQEEEKANFCIRSILPCHSAGDITRYCEHYGYERISDLVFANELSWREPAQIKEDALKLWTEIKHCIYRGVHKEGILPGGLNVSRRASALHKKLMKDKSYQSVDDWFNTIVNIDKNFSGITKLITCFALAVNEENASFGRIITAPTNGASGVIPAVLMYSQTFTQFKSDDDVIRFLLVAGEIGTLFKKNATISAAMGGCQAEIGVSSAMAAAGLTEIAGGSPGQVLMAAEIAMEHHLGMTCDPVGGLVQIPCIERNAMGAMKAITASHLALESDPTKAVVSLDDVIESMWQTAQDMNSRYKETSEGGLAIAVNVPEC